MVKLTYSGLNYRFDMCVVFITNYFLVGGAVPIESEALLLTDFLNVKIKPVQCFGCTHRVRMYVHVFIGVSAHTYISICVYTVFLKQNIAMPFVLSG
jgi:hypothetical protein